MSMPESAEAAELAAELEADADRSSAIESGEIEDCGPDVSRLDRIGGPSRTVGVVGLVGHSDSGVSRLFGGLIGQVLAAREPIEVRIDRGP